MRPFQFAARDRSLFLAYLLLHGRPSSANGCLLSSCLLLTSWLSESKILFISRLMLKLLKQINMLLFILCYSWWPKLAIPKLFQDLSWKPGVSSELQLGSLCPELKPPLCRLSFLFWAADWISTLPVDIKSLIKKLWQDNLWAFSRRL